MGMYPIATISIVTTIISDPQNTRIGIEGSTH